MPGVFDSYPNQAVINLFYLYTFVQPICNKDSDTPGRSLSLRMSMFVWKVIVFESNNISYKIFIPHCFYEADNGEFREIVS